MSVSIEFPVSGLNKKKKKKKISLWEKKESQSEFKFNNDVQQSVCASPGLRHLSSAFPNEPKSALVSIMAKIQLEIGFTLQMKFSCVKVLPSLRPP